jgi:hypothetical protein
MRDISRSGVLLLLLSRATLPDSRHKDLLTSDFLATHSVTRTGLEEEFNPSSGITSTSAIASYIYVNI